MSLQRRTLCFVLLLFLENGLHFVAGVSVETITTEYINPPQGPQPPPNSVLSITSTNRLQPEPLAPKAYSYGPYPPPPPVVRPYETYPSYTTTTVEISNPQTRPEPRTETVKVIERPESPQQLPNPRFPSFPPRPSNPPTIQETLQTRYFPDRYPQTVETTEVTYPSNEEGSNKPLILQINVPVPEPVATVLPQPPSMPTYSPNGMPPSPVIVMEKSKKSGMKSILPILFLSLFDGGRGNNGCCCCSKPTNIPVPYPIAYPVNNPVVANRGKGKGKKPAKDDDDDDNDDK